jgi:hypothetical protein
VAAREPAAVAAEPLDAPTIEQAPVAAPVATGAPSIDAPIAEETATLIGSDGNGEVWSWMAALLAALGLGGGAIALRRTRTRKSAVMMAEARQSDAEYDRRLAGPHDRVTATPAANTVTTPVPAPAPARFDQPLMPSSTMSSTAAARSAPRPSPAAARGEMTVDERRLEALIAQAPSRDNPFKTRANRKRRALFLLRNSYPMQSAA